jgi:hypothetical protein
MRAAFENVILATDHDRDDWQDHKLKDLQSEAVGYDEDTFFSIL